MSCNKLSIKKKKIEQFRNKEFKILGKPFQCKIKKSWIKKEKLNKISSQSTNLKIKYWIYNKMKLI